MQNKFFIQLFCLFLSAILLTSCGIISINSNSPHQTETTTSTGSDPDTETDPSETVEAPDPPVDIPEPGKWEIRKEEAQQMLDNQVYISFDDKILSIVDSCGTFSDPLVQNNIYSEALYERYNMLKKKYGMTISIATVERDSLYDDYINTVKGGNTYADMLSVPLRDTAKFIQSGYIQNLRSLPFFKASGEYSIPSFDEARFSYDDSWFSTGYATLSPDDLGCIYFNRTLAKDADIDLYSLVQNGEFTIEKYLEILIQTNASTVKKDGMDMYLTSLELSDKSFFETGYGKEISLSSTVFTNALSDVTQYLSVLMQNSVSVPEGQNDLDVFSDGGVLFRYGTLGEIESISELKMFFGVLPMPKTSTESGYKTPVSDMTAALMITSNTAHTEMCSVMVSALNAASYKWLLDSAGLHYVNYYVPDIGSAEMIKIIIENPILDFSASARHLTPWYDVLIYDPMSKLLKNPNESFSSLYTAANLRSLKSELNKYYK